VKFGAARKFDAAGKKSSGTRVSNGVLDSTADLVDDIDRMNDAIHRHCDMRPAHNVRLDRSNICDLAFLYRDEPRTFRAGLLDDPKMHSASSVRAELILSVVLDLLVAGFSTYLVLG
jgi:hypothetical protein